MQITINDPASPAEVTGFIIHPDGGVDIAEDCTIHQFKKGLGLFKWAQSKLKLSFSEYIRKGRIKFGIEAVDGAMTQLEFDMPTVQVALDIATIPEDMRQPNLTAEHYIVLARAEITPPKRRKWALVASQQLLTPAQLKTSIETGEVVTGRQQRDEMTGIISVHGIRQETEVWLRRVKGVQGIVDMAAPVQKEILKELEFMAKLYEEIKLAIATKPKTPKTKTKAKKPAKKAAKKK